MLSHYKRQRECFQICPFYVMLAMGFSTPGFCIMKHNYLIIIWSLFSLIQEGVLNVVPLLYFYCGAINLRLCISQASLESWNL